MLAKLMRGSLIPILLLLAMLMLAGCDSASQGTSPEAGTYLIDPVFREFYASLGGRDTMGPAISALFNYRSKECQYTQSALMCFDAQAQGIARFGLYPLGDSLGIQERPGPPAGEGLVVDGYSIYEEFVDIYHQLNGPLYVGQPLTQPRYNVSKDRIEQYFQNVGFYRSIQDEPGDVHLLSYGVFACSADCRFSPPQSSAVTSVNASVAQPYLSQLVRLGGLNVFGMPLTDPYMAPDGNLEQIYENVVLYSPPDDTGNLRLRPTALMLGMPATQPGSRQYDESQGMVFYPVDGDLGFHVPLQFDHFIAQHGGQEISGKPLSEVAQVKGSTYRQCFENYCLIYDSSAAESLQVRMDSLGLEYFRLTRPEQAAWESEPAVDAEEIRIVANAGDTRIPANQSQRFDVYVVRAADNQPVANVDATLTLTLPDGSSLPYAVPPTDSQGRASLTVDPIEPELANGTVVSFRVCLNVPADGQVCVSDSYLIWNLN